MKQKQYIYIPESKLLQLIEKEDYDTFQELIILRKNKPDKYEVIGALIALVGVFIMFYIPR